MQPRRGAKFKGNPLSSVAKRYGLTHQRERERESKIKELRKRIAELESITNRTTEQEEELVSKKEELVGLEKPTTNENNDKKPTN